MRGYSWHNFFSANERRAYEAARVAVEAVDDNMQCKIPSGDALGHRSGDVRCHEIAFALINVLVSRCIVSGRVALVSGQFSHTEHSWIALGENTILDPYCVGRAPMVQLINIAHPMHEVGKLYVVSPFPRLDYDVDCATRLISTMSRALDDEGIVESDWEIDPRGRKDRARERR